MIPHILGSDSVTVFFKGNSYTINRQAATFDLVIQAISSQDEQALENALDIRKKITSSFKKSLGDKVSIDNNKIFYEDREVTGLIVSRIFEIMKMGLDVKPMVLFLENLMLNPSKRAVDELFGFLDACKLPITPDGHFLAYKRVREDYKDCHSGTMDNSVGKVLEIPRNMVDEDKNNTCSYGLHFCSYDYLKHFGGARILVLKINPADVVAIPADYNNSKGRTCRYEVIDELPLDDYKMPVYEISVKPEYYQDEEYDWDEAELITEEILDEDGAIEQIVRNPSNISSKLTEHEVRDIKRDLKQGYTVVNIAVTYGISERQVRRIRDGEAWKWVV